MGILKMLGTNFTDKNKQPQEINVVGVDMFNVITHNLGLVIVADRFEDGAPAQVACNEDVMIVLVEYENAATMHRTFRLMQIMSDTKTDGMLRKSLKKNVGNCEYYILDAQTMYFTAHMIGNHILLSASMTKEGKTTAKKFLQQIEFPVK